MARRFSVGEMAAGDTTVGSTPVSGSDDAVSCEDRRDPVHGQRSAGRSYRVGASVLPPWRWGKSPTATQGADREVLPARSSSPRRSEKLCDLRYPGFALPPEAEPPACLTWIRSSVALRPTQRIAPARMGSYCIDLPTALKRTSMSFGVAPRLPEPSSSLGRILTGRLGPDPIRAMPTESPHSKERPSTSALHKKVSGYFYVPVDICKKCL